MTILVVGTGYRAQAITETFLNQKCKVILVPKIPELVPRYVLLEESLGDGETADTEKYLEKNGLRRRIQAKHTTGTCHNSETNSEFIKVKKRRSTSFTDKMFEKLLLKKSRNNHDTLQTTNLSGNHTKNIQNQRNIVRDQSIKGNASASMSADRNAQIVDQMFPLFSMKTPWKENKEIPPECVKYFRERNELRWKFSSNVAVADTFEEIDQAIQAVLNDGGSIALIFLACEYQFIMSIYGLKLVQIISKSLTKKSKGTYAIYCFYRQIPNMLSRLEEYGVHSDNVAIVTTFHDLKALPQQMASDQKVTNYWYGYKRPVYLFPKCGTSSSKYRFDAAMKSYEEVFGTRLDVQPENYNEEFNSLSIRSKFGWVGVNCLKRGLPSLFAASDPDVCMSLYLGNKSTPDHLYEFLAPFYVGLQLLRADKNNKPYNPDGQYNKAIDMNRHELVAKAIKEVLAQRPYWYNVNIFWNLERIKGFEDWFMERASGSFRNGKEILEDPMSLLNTGTFLEK
eukprot:CAMPEP_0204831036 /NCGR_PEP_ID=MMETSP1346-20131115/9674_1 /ASSEMBLY_ACC=CAM_ASM_000771 /TAXON_ID=215587 /ORGANISM="Aplanochytrium stocchinoi, Strain GSBS06" /LENGTH=509 /DNA_ID=CAMNT_0051961713 /DNA_START=103 /DNA_END=1633 /DNA_ORIENTATION=-